MTYPKHATRPRVATIALIAAGVAVFIAPLAAEAARPEGRVKVMARNLYLGADLTPALEAGDPFALAFAAQQIWNNVHTTDFPNRAKLLAKEIRDAKPDLVGLQEVALWRGDFEAPAGDGPQTPAETVAFDFLDLLMDRLNKRRGGPKYRIVRQQKEADIEAPLSAGNPGDGRLTMRDVVLKRRTSKVKTMFDYSQRFEKESSLVVEDIGGVAGFDVTVWRGFIAMDAKVHGTKLRFVNTHLEAFDNDAKLAQAEELVAGLPNEIGPANPAGTDNPVVLVGDLNTDDEIVETLGDTPQHQADELPYAALVAAGLEERSYDGLNTDGLDDQFSCCFSAELINGAPPAALDDIDHTVDHVMVSDDNHGVDDPDDIDLMRSFATGDDPTQFARFNRWASDHLGVVSVLQFPTP